MKNFKFLDFKKLVSTFTFFISFISLIQAQDYLNWPIDLNYFTEGTNKVSMQNCDSIEVKHRVVVAENFGQEFYCNGNLHAEGPLIKIDTEQVIPFGEDKAQTRIEYMRSGFWKVYFNSTPKTMRSTGNFKNGERDGLWKIYKPDGKLKKEYIFYKDHIKSEVAIDSSGTRKVIVSKSTASILFNKYTVLIILLGALPITLFRIGFNILTYNKVYQTNYIPGFQGYTTDVNLASTFIFWWIVKNSDTEEVKSYKTIANWISIISLVCFLLLIAASLAFGSNK